MFQAIRRYANSAACAAIPGAIRRIADKKSIVLTFDDGPHPVATPRALDTLARFGMKATFFLTGSQCAAYPEIVTQCRESGHAIGNHGYEHIRHIRSRSQSQTSIARTQQVIYSITGETPLYFRPPYGVWLPYHAGILRRQHLSLVLWSSMPGDFLHNTTAEDVYSFLRRTLRGGDIIVLHDNQQTAGRIERIVGAVHRAAALHGLTTTFLQ